MMRFTTSFFAVSLVASCAAAQTRPAIAVPRSATTGTGSSGTASGVPANANARPGAPSVSPESYIIGPGDALQVFVWKEPTLSSSGVSVRPDGRISLPLLGDLPAAGMTPMTLGKDIADKLRTYIKEPIVTVTMVDVAPQEIFLIGEINKTGPIVLSPGMNVLQALSAAGGLAPYAKKKLYILRAGPKGQQKLQFDYKKALSTGDMQGIQLMPGDTVVIP